MNGIEGNVQLVFVLMGVISGLLGGIAHAKKRHGLGCYKNGTLSLTPQWYRCGSCWTAVVFYAVFMGCIFALMHDIYYAGTQTVGGAIGQVVVTFFGVILSAVLTLAVALLGLLAIGYSEHRWPQCRKYKWISYSFAVIVRTYLYHLTRY